MDFCFISLCVGLMSKRNGEGEYMHCQMGWYSVERACHFSVKIAIAPLDFMWNFFAHHETFHCTSVYENV